MHIFKSNLEQITYEKPEEKKLNYEINNERDLENKVLQKDYDNKNVNQNNHLINENRCLERTGKI